LNEWFTVLTAVC